MSRWPVVHNEESHVITNKTIVFISLKIDFVLANSADPDESISSGCSLFANLSI